MVHSLQNPRTPRTNGCTWSDRLPFGRQGPGRDEEEEEDDGAAGPPPVLIGAVSKPKATLPPGGGQPCSEPRSSPETSTPLIDLHGSQMLDGGGWTPPPGGVVGKTPELMHCDVIDTHLLARRLEVS